MLCLQRAHAWHSSLPGLPQDWTCYDMPYFDAPGECCRLLQSWVRALFLIAGEKHAQVPVANCIACCQPSAQFALLNLPARPVPANLLHAAGSTVTPLSSSGGDVASQTSASLAAAGTLPHLGSDCAAVARASSGSSGGAAGLDVGSLVPHHSVSGALHALQQHLHSHVQSLPPVTMVFAAVEVSKALGAVTGPA